jgi:hypothetical protein
MIFNNHRGRPKGLRYEDNKSRATQATMTAREIIVLVAQGFSPAVLAILSKSHSPNNIVVNEDIYPTVDSWNKLRWLSVFCTAKD